MNTCAYRSRLSFLTFANVVVACVLAQPAWVNTAALCHAQPPEPPNVQSLAFSKDGQLLAIATSNHIANGGLFVWDLKAHKLVYEQREPEIGFVAVDFSESGTLAVGRFANTGLLYDVETWDCIGELKGHANHVCTVKFMSGGKRLITGSYDGTVKVWDVATREELFSLDDHPGEVDSLALSKDNSKLAVAVSRGSYEVWLWDLSTRQTVAKYKPFGSLVPSVAMTTDGKFIAAASWDGNASLFGIDDEERKLGIDFQPGGGADCVAFSGDGNWLAVGGSGLYVQSIGAPEGEMGERIDSLFQQLDSDDYATRVAATDAIIDAGASAQSAVLRGLSADSPEVRWRCRKIRNTLSEMQGATQLTEGVDRTRVAFSDDSRLFASGDNTGKVILWDTTTWKPIETIQIKP